MSLFGLNQLEKFFDEILEREILIRTMSGNINNKGVIYNEREELIFNRQPSEVKLQRFAETQYKKNPI
jgi:hypothetical protein